MTPALKSFLDSLRACVVAHGRRIDDLQAQLDEIATKYEVARAAEQNWRVALKSRNSDGKIVITFRSDAGCTAEMPFDLARVIADRGCFDGSVIEGEETISFERDGGTLAEIPKSLFVGLDRILESWNARKT